MPITQPSPEELEAILREIGTYIFHELSDDEWLGELVEREEQAYQQNLEMHMQSHCGLEANDSAVYVCAICKMGYVHRSSQGDVVRVACENQNCLDLTMPGISDPRTVHVEKLMTALNGPVLEHK